MNVKTFLQLWSEVMQLFKLTLMLLVRRIVEPHGDEDEEDEERPDDLHQELKLRDRDRKSSSTHTHTKSITK